MPSQYTISANEHFVMIFVLNWEDFFFLLISSILASRHQGETQGCSLRDSRTLPSSSLFSAAVLDLFTPPTSTPPPFFFLSVLG